MRRRSTLTMISAAAGAFVLQASASLAQGCGPTRLKVSESVVLGIPPAEAWSIVGNFQDASWNRRTVSTNGTGGNVPDEARRTVTLANGAVFGESLYKYDPAAMSYAYHIDKIDVDALPVQNVSASLEVRPVDGGTRSRIVWRGAFYRYLKPGEGAPDAADAAARDSVSAYFRAGLDGLAARFASKS